MFIGRQSPVEASTIDLEVINTVHDQSLAREYAGEETMLTRERMSAVQHARGDEKHSIAWTDSADLERRSSEIRRKQQKPAGESARQVDSFRVIRCAERR